MAHTPQVVVKNVIDLLGGREAAFAHFDDEFRYISERWSQDTDAIGRILRCHLFVEHFLTAFLVQRNPELGSVSDARLSFAQKVTLIGQASAGIAYLIPGIRRLNTIRNRMAHTLAADITTDDINIFLGITLFKAMREARAKPNSASTVPVDILEDFAKHAGTCLQASVSLVADLWEKAMADGEPDAEPATE